MPENELSLPSQLGKRIAYLRKEKGYSQLELALRSSLSKNYISDLEKGRRNPTLGVLERLAKGLDTTLEDLFRGLVTLDQLL
jgi:transcriptional regulator with XRE-family HTH domain